jgi:vacuolar-type H+-ATPase subunit F/Vma7
VKIVALGPPDDIRGFALAGVETARCETGHDADHLISAMCRAESDVGLVLVSRSIAEAAVPAIARARAGGAAPVFLILPWG